MKLLSCDCCGVIIDGDKINWPEHTSDDNNEHTFHWNGDRMVACIPCPVCKSDIREDGE